MLSREKLKLTDPALAKYTQRYKVTASGCWEWTGYCGGKMGYARLSHRGFTYLMHRVAYAQHYGYIDARLMVRHYVCDNPPCINPLHLRQGTAKDNTQDMLRHARSSAGKPNYNLRGERNGRSKLSDTQVAEIRKQYATGTVTMRALGAQFGISSGAISNIIHGKRRTHTC